MNLKANKQKKDLVLKMINEIAKFTRDLEKIPDIQKDIKTSKLILKGFLKEAFEFEPLIKIVDNKLHHVKGKSITFWTSLVKIIREYFEEAKKIDKS